MATQSARMRRGIGRVIPTYATPDRVVYASRALPSGLLGADLVAGTGPDSSDAINQLLGNLSASGGARFILDRAVKGNFVVPPNIVFEGACQTRYATSSNIGIVNGLQSGMPALRNANPTAGTPTDNTIVVKDLYVNAGRYLGAAGAGTSGATPASDPRVAVSWDYPVGWGLTGDVGRIGGKPFCQSGVLMLGVLGLRLENVWVHDPATFAFVFSNVQDVDVLRPRMSLRSPPVNWSSATAPDGYPWNQDFLHFGGLCSDAFILNSRGTSADDWLALNAPEFYLGAITGVEMFGGRSTGSAFGVRLYTTAAAPIDDVYVNGLAGSFSGDLVNCYNAAGGDAGNVGDVRLYFGKVTPYGNATLPGHGQGLVNVADAVRSLEVRLPLGLWKDPTGLNRPIVRTFANGRTASVDRLVVSVQRIDDPSGTTNNPAVVVGDNTTVNTLELADVDVERPDAVTAGGVLVDVQGTASVGTLRGKGVRTRRGKYLVQTSASATVGKVNLSGVLMEQYTPDAKLLNLGGTLAEAVVSNYGGPVDGSSKAAFNGTITRQRGDAFMTNGAGNGDGQMPASSLNSFYATGAYYTLDEAAGANRVDSFGVAPPLAEVNGTVAQQPTGAINQSAGPFNSNNHYLAAASDARFQPGSGDWAGSAWVASLASGQTARVCGKWDIGGDNGEWQVVLVSGVLNFAVTPDGTGASAVLCPATNFGALPVSFVFVRWWIDATAHTLNVSVNNVAETPVAFASAVHLANTVPFTAGALVNDTIPFAGIVDELGIAKQKWTPTLATAAYNAGAGLSYPF